MLSCFRSLWSHVVEWLPDILPAISNLILVLLGIIMSLPVLAEKIEKTPRYRKWLAAVCLVFGLTGFIFDVVQRHSTEQATRQLIGNTNTMVGSTNDLVQTTRAMVNAVSVLGPKLNAVQGEIATLAIQIKAAKEKRDPKLLADLEARMKQAKDQADRMTRELHFLTLVPQLAEQLRNWRVERESRQRELHNFAHEEEIHWREQHGDESEEESWAKWESIYKKADADSLDQLKTTITDADSARQELLQSIPSRTPDDDKWEQEFAKAKNDPESLPLEKAARYLEELARRVPPPK